jgi:hypothetical protein
MHIVAVQIVKKEEWRIPLLVLTVRKATSRLGLRFSIPNRLMRGLLVERNCLRKTFTDSSHKRFKILSVVTINPWLPGF